MWVPFTILVLLISKHGRIMENYKETATKVVNAIKKELKARTKEGKNAKIRVEVYQHKVGGETYYDINFGDKKFGKMEKICQVGWCFEEMIKQLKQLRNERGYKNLTYETHEMGNYPSYYTIVDCVCLLKNPCSEFVKLKNYIKRTANYIFGDFDIYSVSMSGKRGQLYGESGSRHYLAHQPKQCEQILSELRKHKGTKDTITCEYKEETYIDENERRASQYYECECSGEEYHYLNTTIKTPSGKTKFVTRIAA